MPTIAARELQALSAAILRAADARPAEAEDVAAHLIDANLAGHDSHGVMRTLQYVDDIRAGHIVPGIEPKFLADWPNGCVIDGRGAFGQVVCKFAMQRAMAKAHAATVGIATIRHANHSGRLGAYVEMAAAENLIGLALVNAPVFGELVAPFGGRERRLSTNPLAVGAPSGNTFPFVLDMATCVAPEGKIRLYRHRNEPVPDGWLADFHGKPTNDPAAFYNKGQATLLPLGGAAGHKGYGMAFMIDILTGALTGNGCCRANTGEPFQGAGIVMAALDIERFVGLSQFHEQVAALAQHMKSCPPAPGFNEVLVPGEFEHGNRQARQRAGIPVPEATWDQLTTLASALGVAQYIPAKATDAMQAG